MGVVNRYPKAVNADLFINTGYTIDDLGDGLSWDVFNDFLTNLGTQSALAKQVTPETSVWGSREKTNIILADIYDVLSAINYSLVKMGGGKPKKPTPYPRPNDKNKVKKYGNHKSALPVNKMREWVKNYQSKKKDKD